MFHPHLRNWRKFAPVTPCAATFPPFTLPPLKEGRWVEPANGERTDPPHGRGGPRGGRRLTSAGIKGAPPDSTRVPPEFHPTAVGTIFAANPLGLLLLQPKPGPSSGPSGRGFQRSPAVLDGARRSWTPRCAVGKRLPPGSFAVFNGAQRCSTALNGRDDVEGPRRFSRPPP